MSSLGSERERVDSVDSISLLARPLELKESFDFFSPFSSLESPPPSALLPRPIPPPSFFSTACSLSLPNRRAAALRASSLSLAFLGLAFSPALNPRTSERKREGTTLARCSLSSISTLASVRLPARKKKRKKTSKNHGRCLVPHARPGRSSRPGQPERRHADARKQRSAHTHGQAAGEQGE